MDGRMASCLTILAASGLLSCADTPTQAPDSMLALSVTATDSVALTYICGNMFRIRNSSFEPRSVRWDIYNANPADTGSLWARGRDVGRTSVDFFVTSRTKGTMRLFVGTTLIATKANGNKAACPVPADLSAFPTAPVIAPSKARVLTSAPTLEESDSVAYRRTIINVQFLPNSSSAARRAFQSRFGAQLVGVFPTALQFRVPDMGPSLSLFNSRINQIRADSAVARATPVQAFGRVINFGARFPSDAVNHRRADYINRAFSVWNSTALRLPQAWWCETGRYGGKLPRIAIYEQNFPQVVSADISTSILTPVVRLTKWRDSLPVPVPVVQNDVDTFTEHGHIVAAAVVASGDDGVGLSSPLWRADLRVFTTENVNATRGAGAETFYELVADEIAKASPRILSFSSDIRPTGDAAQRETEFFYLTMKFKSLMDSLPRLLIVQAIGNDSVTTPYTLRDSTKRYVIQEALVSLRDSGANYRDRIVFVGASNVNGSRGSFSNAYPGLVDVYSPGVDVPVLLPGAIIDTRSGTSFAAPTVASIAGQMLAMDSTLSAADLKALLLAGAQDSVENANGDNIAPSPVGNTSDVVYEADAYGSLRLLSARAGRPLCGATVLALRKQVSPNPLGNAPLQLHIRRYSSGITEDISRDENNDVMLNDRSGNMLSVAPGGRGISLSSVIPNLGTATNLFALTPSGWVAQPKRMNTLAILYGERDTAFIDETGSTIFATTAGRQPPVSLGFTFPQGVSGFSFSFAPDGSAIALVSGTSSPSNQQGIHIIWRDGTRDSAIANFSDVPAGQHTVWSPDSRSVAMSIASAMSPGPNVFYYDSKVVRYAVSSTLVTELERSTVLSDPLQVPQSLTTTAEGGRIQMVIGSEDDLRTNSDCTLRSVRTNGLAGLRTELNLAPSPCPSGYIPPGNGGGGMDGRIARQKAPLISARFGSGAAHSGSADTSRRRRASALP